MDSAIRGAGAGGHHHEALLARRSSHSLVVIGLPGRGIIADPHQ